MEQPPLTDAPIEWLKAVVSSTKKHADEKTFPINIKAASDGEVHTFEYTLADIRAEFTKRTSN